MTMFSPNRRAAAARRTAGRLRFESLETRLAMAFSAVGAPVQVVQVNEGFVGESDIAMDSSGNFVTVWTEGVRSGSNVDLNLFARRYDRLGTPLGQAFQVNTLDNNPNQARIDMTPDGRFVIAWQSPLRESSTGTEVYVRMFSSDGTPVSGEVLASIAEQPDASLNPDISINDSGAFVVVWEGTSTSLQRDGIFARQFDASLSPMGDEIEVDVGRGTSKYQPEVAIYNDGGFVATWTWDDNILPEQFQRPGQGIREFDSAGRPKAEPIEIFEVSLPSDIDALSTANSKTVAFLNYYSPPIAGTAVELRVSNGPQLLLSSPIVVATEGFPSEPSVHISTSGIVVAWQTLTQTNLRLYSLDGVPLADTMVVALRPDHLLVATSGDHVVVSLPTNHAVFFQRFSLTPLPGDVNGDEKVNIRDFALLRNNFGQSSKQRYEGDLTGDGKVDMADFSELRENFGKKGSYVAALKQAIDAPPEVIAAALLNSINTTDEKAAKRRSPPV